MMLLPLILLNLLFALGVNGHRQKRYLVYPDGGPARAQIEKKTAKYAFELYTESSVPPLKFIKHKCSKYGSNTKDKLNFVVRNNVGKYIPNASFIIGLGIPVDLKEASVTVGAVIKFQYDLPTNSSEYTSRIYGFANTVSRDMDGETPTNDETNEIDSDSETMANNDGDIENNDEERDNDTLVDITFDDRRKRSLLYSEGGVMVSGEADVNTEIPLQEAIRRQELIDQNNLADDSEPQRMNRWDFYKILEHMFERYGYSGRPCLLRTICEAAEVPFTHENGLLGEIGHILFTPSSTRDQLSHHTDNEYHAAERFGRDAGVSCETLFPDCEGSILSTFTALGEETLHKFGLI